MTLSTHVLDTARGTAAAGIAVGVERWEPASGWSVVNLGVTGPDGRLGDLVPPAEWRPGRWRLSFATGDYLGPDAFLPEVVVEFRTTSREHHHVPLLLSPYGYTTYRGT